jgi:NodT family efflux transporter outer membrane factor (OMF) lipoprotein
MVSIFNDFRLLAQIAPLFFVLTGCVVGPDYVRSDVETPPAFKEQAGWKIAEPGDLRIPVNWWEMYQDPVLNALEVQVAISNQTVIQAEAQYRQARALVQSAEAAYYPTVAANVSSTRASGVITVTGSTKTKAPPSTTDLLVADVSWEPDIWGRVRRMVEANASSAQASAAELQAMRLSTQAQLAQDYFQLRDQDADRQLFDKTVVDYKKSLDLTQYQFDNGLVLKENLVLAQTQLAQTEAQAIDFDVARAQMEHAIALLVGKPASTFSIAKTDKFDTPIPVLPLGLPSSLLERRPDIANAERLVAAANAQIGVAKAAYFPDLTLAASGGYQSSGLANWISLPNRIWSVGPSLAETLFDGGLRSAATDQAIAAYDASVANYRQTVLTGFQEVEDNIAALRILEQEAKQQQLAVQLSRKSVELTTRQYQAGMITYLDVITVDTTALANERTYIDLLNKRLAAHVALIKALGGGWSVSQLPDVKTVSN